MTAPEGRWVRSRCAGLSCVALVLGWRASIADEPRRALEEIVVTASKRAESARDVGAALSAVSGESLEQLGAAHLQDFASYIPGVSSMTMGAGQNELIVRGVSTGGNTQAVATTGVYFDEVPVGSSTAFALGGFLPDLDVFDLERIELLSGPQGTLYGASTLGGLLKYVTRAPNLDEAEEVLTGEVSSTEAGGFNHTEHAAVNIPIVRDRLAVRANGNYSRNNGFIDNPNRNLEDIDASELYGGRLSLLGQLAPGMSLQLGALVQKSHRDGNTVADRDRQSRRAPPTQGKLDRSIFLDEPYDQNLLLYSGVLSWDLNWAALTAASGWQRIQLSFITDNTALYGPLLGTGDAIPFGAFLTQETKKFTQEVRLASPSADSLEWLIGAYYADEETDQFVRIFNAASPDGTLSGLKLFEGDIPTAYREIAGFGNLTAHFTEQFDVTFGVRYSEDRQQQDQMTQGAFALIGSGAAKSRGHSTTYLFNPRLRINDDWMMYVRAASSYRPGGPNFRTRDISTGEPVGNPTFEPDTLWNYEIGAKADLFNGRATVDAAVYHIDWKDIQVIVNRNGVNQLENATAAKIDGIELSARYLAANGLQLGGSASYIDARLSEDAPTIGAQEGQRLPRSPRFSSALTAQYNFPLASDVKASFGISYRYMGGRNAGFDGSTRIPQYRLGAFDLVDLRFGVKHGALDLSLFFKNVLDEAGEVSANTGGLIASTTAPAPVSITQPRTVGLEATFRMTH